MGQVGIPAQSKAQAMQTSTSAGGKGKAFSQESGGVFPGHEEHSRQEFSCIFVSLFHNKIFSIILILRDLTLLYTAAEV